MSSRAGRAYRAAVAPTESPDGQDRGVSPRPESGYARSGDVHLAYQVTGNGPVDLVLVTGATSTSLLWEEQMTARFLRRVTSFARLVSFDQRGAGWSDPVSPSRLPTLEERVDDLRTVMDAVLLGTHDGGPVSMMFAATYPERTRALVLCNTWARVARAPDVPWGLTDDLLADGRRMYEQLWGTGFSIDVVAPSLAGDAHARRAWARHERATGSPTQALALMEMAMELDVRDILPTITVPTLVVHAREDLVAPVEHGRYLTAHIAGSRFVELPGSDHAFVVTDADALLDEVEDFLTGVRRGPEPDRVLATVLFTDIVGSTQRAVELGDRRWHDLLQRHHATVRRELARHRGREVDTAGDGFLATFDGPARAIRCACAITDAVSQLGIQDRAGLHTGECEVHDGGVAGIAIHIGARVSAQAGPGEVLVSSTVKDLVAGSGLRFVDRGAYRLKGVPEEWRLFAVAR
jgi:class 3 adenylate cyclase